MDTRSDRPLMSEGEMAAVLGISRRTLRDLRLLGGGPPVVREGGTVGYRPTAVGAWFAKRMLDGNRLPLPLH